MALAFDAALVVASGAGGAAATPGAGAAPGTGAGATAAVAKGSGAAGTPGSDSVSDLAGRRHKRVQSRGGAVQPTRTRRRGHRVRRP